MGAKSESDAMQELASLLWSRFLKERVREELTHGLTGYKAEVVTNNGDGTLTVKRPFESSTLTLKCAAALNSAVPGDQVLIIGMGDKSTALSNAFILCKTNLSNLEEVPLPYPFNPNMDGAASPGTNDMYARGDHVHPSDTSRVPTTREVNGHPLSSDITLDAADVGAVDANEVGVAGGVASLGNDGKVPSEQLPAIASTAADVTYDNTQSGLSATDVQEAIDELASGGSASGKADQTTVAPVEASTTAAATHGLGSIFYLNGVLYRALSDIAIGDTINTAVGGNATQTTVAENFTRTVKLTSAQYAQLSAAEKAADIVYIITDDNTIPASGVSYDGSASGLSAITAQGAIDELEAEKADKTDIASIQATGSTNATGSKIPAGTLFYLDGAFVQAKVDIPNGASFTLNTNYETATVGGQLSKFYAETGDYTVTSGVLRFQGTSPVELGATVICSILRNDSGTWNQYVAYPRIIAKNDLAFYFRKASDGSNAPNGTYTLSFLIINP